MLLASTLWAQEQTRNKQTVIRDTHTLYDQVLARVFTPQVEHSSDEAFSLSLVFQENEKPESEIVIKQGRGSSAVIELFQADRQLERAIASAVGTGVEGNPDALAAQIHVNRRELKVVSARSFRWQKALFSALSAANDDLSKKARDFYANGSIDVTLDADSYYLTYDQGLTAISVHFFEPGAMATWAANLKREIQAIANGK